MGGLCNFLNKIKKEIARLKRNSLFHTSKKDFVKRAPFPKIFCILFPDHDVDLNMEMKLQKIVTASYIYDKIYVNHRVLHKVLILGDQFSYAVDTVGVVVGGRHTAEKVRSGERRLKWI
ncbi:hypothetical protein PHYBLDRAFT_70009 [Phycomyces blakesleeanus NRRL 1555(-)]|uniref:Uncharacterized protein n=1 Tax=Phycomyces blakesleeanus (strain ATCC 8743b / DSM 1359 / FGSC 10004 / NBRC 33097 / NRRL 1555) TaxID=763407 RepID=A0A162TX04_PHYB8|nr:hypothetical protein PHYBLDRAFT_70009 [Phycomyces blakesleeanus NRRL 1555(-)]OAD71652.1 hypothetical protein PHYBLDRAFT_70009 [Phycomyces blakesleeanus NRRL 1555(-)]|eukprot:XP_018289692.1 hypothetical protein PHYBLDRAFT_70009 [Phycomyces blakesleeanus NRRL 1555(-)]